LIAVETTGKMDFGKLRKTQGLQEYAKHEFRNPRSWRKTQGVVSQLIRQTQPPIH